MEIDFNASNKNLWKEIYDNENLHHCYNCGTCITGCPASHGNPPLLVRNLARMVILGLEEELLDDPTPWSPSPAPVARRCALWTSSPLS